MEEISQGSLDDISQTKEILRLKQAKKNLDNLNLDLEKDMLNLDEANQDLVVQIREKELQIQSLEKQITKSIGLVGERDEFNHTAYEKEEALKNLKLETAKLEKSNEILARNVNELRVKLSRKLPENSKEVEKENLKQMLEESKVKLQKTITFYAEQEKELAKVISEYQSVDQLCKDQAYYIKKYQEILRLMEEDREILLLETEITKAQNIYNQSNLILEENLFRKGQRHFCLRIAQFVFLMVVFLTRMLSFGILYLHFINPNFVLDNLPKIMNRDTLCRLRNFLLPSLNLHIQDILPH
ncbi:transmembrane and coiled-coil domain-containing protein 5B-like [Phascolarctos cinereus]|uniref:Transmembrane and coiled-coil domain-containing protein 5B-like n=1 Tax=Phascolarctos cinereus TaxID=38626 RepID=A0A6P5KXH8_PHACI|nr:transmembrane and coiled-coil domain-containing protein 5B-like [Phascolarctos cinereus]XP_020849304.1 transmembrane and coiled-coil domain-containing protein 5B-like [Phascolarctos cinereus]XP_020849960.1 transmembrane and coiled-coil domain-containing protein 5B-like [Phascolarctos cinereus]XP_020850721.1 transmembrane and coiled-coil domain-containing protein 5B-like [Phascolarctos cinereus]